MQETWVRSLGREDPPGEENGNPLQYSCLENPMDGGAWWATVHRIAKSRTRLSGFTFTFILHNFNYYLSDFVTAICLGIIFGFSFLDICFNLT